MAARTYPHYGVDVDLEPKDQPSNIFILRTYKMEEAGADKVFLAEEVIDINTIAEALQPFVAKYGASKLFQDRNSATPVQDGKMAGMLSTYEDFKAGKKEKDRVVGPQQASPEVEALAQLKGVSIPVIQKSLGRYSKEQKKQILENPRVVELAKQIREAREQEEAVDLTDL